MNRRSVSLPLMMVGCCLTLLCRSGSLASGQKEAVTPGSRRPLVAIWCDDQGTWVMGGAPYLRIALWEDGRVLFATDTKKWGHQLQEGKISAVQVTELRKQVADTGIFDLKRADYLVPDAPVDCILVDLGAKKQLLSWDERESPSYGIGVNPTSETLKFKQCWKAVNRLVLALRPKNAKPVKGRFKAVPRSWYLDSR